MKRLLSSAGARTMVLLLVTQTLHAAAILGVAFPNLQRPKDGALYNFNVFVGGTYGLGGDLLGNAYDANYIDVDLVFNDNIHLRPGGLVIPVAPAGAIVGDPFFVAVTFQVGCTIGGEVFGPNGLTGENPLNFGRFDFATPGASSWQAQVVTCVAANAAPPYGTPGGPSWTPPPLPPNSWDSDKKKWNPLPGPYVAADVVVPEPRTAWLVLTGAILLGIGRRSRRRPTR